MSSAGKKPILARGSGEELVGRSTAIDAILAHAAGRSRTNGISLLSTPGSGASELLKRAYDVVFRTATDLIPIYFAFDRRDGDAVGTARRFVREFLAQTVAFGRRDLSMIYSTFDLPELSRRALPRDGFWFDSLIESLRIEGDSRLYTRSCFSAPLRAGNTKFFLVFDDLHELMHIAAADGIFDDLKETYRNAPFPFIFSARRRFFGSDNEFPRMMLEPLSMQDAGILAERLATERGIAISEPVRDLLALECGGNPSFIESIIRRAFVDRIPLTSFPNAQRAYSEELFAGEIGLHFDSLFAAATPTLDAEENILGLLFDAVDGDSQLTSVEKWRKRTGLRETEFEHVLEVLSVSEVVRLTSNRVEPMTENTVLCDYVRCRFRLEIAGENRALVYAESLAEFAKRSPKMMSRAYREAANIDLRALMSRFDAHRVPSAFIDYGAFKEEYKGLPEADAMSRMLNDENRIELPKIVFAAHTEAFYRAMGMHTDRERSAVAIGFQDGSYTDEDEVVWLAAEIDSKMEATRELTEFWCDRLETAALMCDFANYRLWLVAPEGFSPEALDLMEQRGCFGSSRRQAELLAEYLGSEPFSAHDETENEYEIVLPMGDESELIAAHTLEEIAKRHGLKSHAINQIKTAVVEACINAAEHSFSPDRRIRLKFTIADGRFTVSVANRGIRLADKISVPLETEEGRRGWGLRLMRRLMDEVKIEHVEDGTLISMSKILEPA